MPMVNKQVTFLGYSHGVKGDVNPKRQRSRAIGGRSAVKHVATRSDCTKQERQNMTQQWRRKNSVFREAFEGEKSEDPYDLHVPGTILLVSELIYPQQSERTKIPFLCTSRSEAREFENRDSDFPLGCACVRQFFVIRERHADR